jgi:Tol biopolymer transport system component
LLFQRDRTLMTQPFDERRMEMIGEAAPVAEIGSFIASGFFSASQNGVLAYRATAPVEFQPTWFDRQGKAMGGAGERGIYYGLTLSPDGTRAAVARSDSQRSLNLNLWDLDLARSASTRVTTGAVLVTSPVWSPDGNRIVFAAVRDGIYNLYVIPASGSKPHEPLLESAQNKTPLSWSADGRWLLYAVLDPKTGNDLWLLPMDRKGEPVRYLGTEFNESAGLFSADGRWIAYASNESGRDEIYIRAFPDTGEKFLISRGGGRDPRWPAKSRELFYLSPDGKVTAVEIPGDPRKSGAPQSLFQAPPSARGWDVSADGKKFLFAAPGDQSSQIPFTVVLNWAAGLRP